MDAVFHQFAINTGYSRAHTDLPALGKSPVGRSIGSALIKRYRDTDLERIGVIGGGLIRIDLEYLGLNVEAALAIGAGTEENPDYPEVLDLINDTNITAAIETADRLN